MVSSKRSISTRTFIPNDIGELSVSFKTLGHNREDAGPLHRPYLSALCDAINQFEVDGTQSIVIDRAIRGSSWLIIGLGQYELPREEEK